MEKYKTSETKAKNTDKYYAESRRKDGNTELNTVGHKCDFKLKTLTHAGKL